jgi:hypothetical protein
VPTSEEQGPIKSIEEIVCITGGWDHLPSHPLKIAVRSYMPLNIEVTGKGPGGGLLLAISHTSVQGGDVVRDPEVVAEVTPGSPDWLPISFRQDNPGVLQEAVVSEGGVFVFHHGLVADLRKFMAFWDEQIRQQGFIGAARTATSQERNPPDEGE